MYIPQDILRLGDFEIGDEHSGKDYTYNYVALGAQYYGHKILPPIRVWAKTLFEANRGSDIISIFFRNVD